MNIIPVHIVGQEMWYAQHIFNPNAFPPYVREEVLACAAKLSLIAYSMEIIQKEINKDKKKFLQILNNDKSFNGFEPSKGRPAVAIYHSVSFQIGLQSFFISTKSLLDIFTKIISKLIDSKSTLRGFGKRKVDGVEMTGGSLLRWLDQNTPSNYNKYPLRTEIRTNIEKWISDVVTKRDEIVHYGTLSYILEMRVPLSKHPSFIIADEIILPKVYAADRTIDLIEYCQGIWKYINLMLKEVLLLLPNIDFNLLSFKLLPESP